MRRLLIALVVVVGATLIGLLLASLLLKQECPDCSGTARFLQENPSQSVYSQPAIIDCPRCDDRGRVSLLNARLGKEPDRLVVTLIQYSNRESWSPTNDPRGVLTDRLDAASLKRAAGRTWKEPFAPGRSRFVRADGKIYVLSILDSYEKTLSFERPIFLLLLDDRGTPLDVVTVRVKGGASTAVMQFVQPVGPDRCCAQISLLNWKNRPFKSVEFDRAGKLWMYEPAEPKEKLDQLAWKVFLRQGRLQIVDAAGKSIAE